MSHHRFNPASFRQDWLGALSSRCQTTG